MSDDGGTTRTVTCSDCGREYPVGGRAGTDPAETSPESAEHHAEGCPVRAALERRGQTADRDVHVEVGQ